jgi:hypothetical protein
MTNRSESRAKGPTRGRIIGEQFTEQFYDPLRCRVGRDVDVEDPSPIVIYYKPLV